MEINKKRIKIGIYAAAMLMMGVIAISSSLAAIGQHFADASQTMISSLISVPCLVVIPVTLISGCLMEKMGKKRLLIIGIVFFLIGGIIPAFLNSLLLILIFRAIFGIGIGLIQTLVSAIIATYFEGAEKDKVQGTATSMQMIGCIIMGICGGFLGTLGWNCVFYIHIIAIVALICAIITLPKDVICSEQHKAQKDTEAGKLNGGTWFWAIALLLFFIAGQVYSSDLSFLVDEKDIGATSQSGISLAFFAIGGIIAGFVFGKLIGKLKKTTLSIGFFILAASYVVIAFAGNMPIIYLGSVGVGIAVSITMACVMIEAGNSVSSAMAGMAVAIATCFQNIGQFLSPYVVNTVGDAIDPSGGNCFYFIISAVFIVILGIAGLAAGLRQNSKTDKGM